MTAIVSPRTRPMCLAWTDGAPRAHAHALCILARGHKGTHLRLPAIPKWGAA